MRIIWCPHLNKTLATNYNALIGRSIHFHEPTDLKKTQHKTGAKKNLKLKFQGQNLKSKPYTFHRDVYWGRWRRNERLNIGRNDANGRGRRIRCWVPRPCIRRWARNRTNWRATSSCPGRPADGRPVSAGSSGTRSSTESAPSAPRSPWRWKTSTSPPSSGGTWRPTSASPSSAKLKSNKIQMNGNEIHGLNLSGRVFNGHTRR